LKPCKKSRPLLLEIGKSGISRKFSDGISKAYYNFLASFVKKKRGDNI
jgi:hypothetical protein